MAIYHHGVRVIEEETALTVPVEGNSGLQVVIGTAPVNLTSDPLGAVNVPILCNNFAECAESLGYSEDFDKYSLCASMYASFKVFAVAPVVFINVLNPAKHKRTNPAKQYAVTNGQIIISEEGILLDSLVIKNGENTLIKDTDYVTSFNDGGYAIVTLLAEGVQSVEITSESIDPEAVTSADIIGGYDAVTGKESGIEVVRQVYPRFGMTAGLLLAPGWSQNPDVAAALNAKCVNLNGVFGSECIIDIDTQLAKKYTDCKGVKEESGITNKHEIAVWPMVSIRGKVIALSALYGALVAYTDASNDDVPNLSPSNKLLNVTGAVLKDGTEVVLDQDQANVLNGQGVVTVLNDGGWKAWGNNTACYPAVTDPKDRWICCRRFFSWWGNSFILTYKNKVDNPANTVLIEAICDAENVRGNSYVSQKKCAGARIEYRQEDNPVTDVLNGKIVFRQHLAPYTPAEDIANILSFDPDMLQSALG